MEQDDGVAALARRVREDPRLLAAFRAEYAGRHDPEDALDWLIQPERPSRRGVAAPQRPDPAVLYRRDTSSEVAAEAATRIRALDAERTETERAVRASPDQLSSAPPAPGGWARRASAAVVIASLSAACAVAVAVALASRAGSDPRSVAVVARTVIDSRGDLSPARFYARFPDALDPAVRRVPPISAVRLDGARAMPLPRGTSPLGMVVVVACTPADRSFEYTLITRTDHRAVAHGYGACGALHPIAVRPRSTADATRLLVTTRGVDPFSVSVYPRATAVGDR